MKGERRLRDNYGDEISRVAILLLPFSDVVLELFADDDDVVVICLGVRVLSSGIHGWQDVIGVREPSDFTWEVSGVSSV